MYINVGHIYQRRQQEQENERLQGQQRGHGQRQQQWKKHIYVTNKI